jgi:hypothetical protein
MDLPDVTSAAVNACGLPSWYPSFEHVSIKSKLIPLEAGVVEYLKSGKRLKLPVPPPGVALLPTDPRYVHASAPVDSSDDDGQIGAYHPTRCCVRGVRGFDVAGGAASACVSSACSPLMTRRKATFVFQRWKLQSLLQSTSMVPCLRG